MSFSSHTCSKSAKSMFIKLLINIQGVTILSHGVITGLTIQFDNDVINLDSFAFPNLVWLARVVIFLATPVMPVFVILRALRLSSEKRKLEAEWRRNQESICNTYLRCSKLDRKKRKVMAALADMKMVEVSTEGVPQLYILIVLIIASEQMCNLEILVDKTSETIIFLVLSLLQTYLTIILAVISSINTRKGGQLGVKAKVLLGLSLSCQIAARLSIMVIFSLSASNPAYPLFQHSTLTNTKAALLILLPIGITWTLNILLHARLDTDFFLLSTKSKLVHLLSTTWFTLPVRRMGERDQRHKGRELTFGCILAAINLMGTIAAGYVEMFFPLERSIWEKVGDFCVFFLAPLLLHLVGCGLLLLFEKTLHPWRQLGKERERRCWGKLQGSKRGIEVEPTVWEQVTFFRK